MNQQWTHRISSPAGRAAVTLTALLALGTGASRAANIYWDSDTNGANNNISTGAGLGAAGNWNNLASGTPLVNWWPGSGTTDQTWVNGTDTAITTHPKLIQFFKQAIGERSIRAEAITQLRRIVEG